MNYFDPYPLQLGRTKGGTVTAAWDSQLAEAAETPWLKEVLLRRTSELFPPFAACYAELQTLPRSARRAFQRRIARSSELAAIFSYRLEGPGGRALQHKLARTLAGAALLLALAHGMATAATLTVTTKDTRVRADGQCSLIEAIVNANTDTAEHADCPAGDGADTIELPPAAKLKLKGVYDDTYGPTGLPVITSPITIQGNGAQIRGKRKFRLMAVSNSGDLTLQNLTLRGGGGAAYNLGTLAIENSTISKNRTKHHGGGVYNKGDLSIENSTFSRNKAAGSGGAVFNSTSSSLAITDSVISGNKAAAKGGGVYNHRGYDGDFAYLAGHLTIENSTISGNKASDGGGVFNAGGYICNSQSDCYFFYVGQYFVAGYLSLVDSTISQNRAKNRGGGLFAYGSPNTTNSTIAGNRARNGSDIFP